VNVTPRVKSSGRHARCDLDAPFWGYSEPRPFW